MRLTFIGDHRQSRNALIIHVQVFKDSSAGVFSKGCNLYWEFTLVIALAEGLYRLQRAIQRTVGNDDLVWTRADKVVHETAVHGAKDVEDIVFIWTGQFQEVSLADAGKLITL